ncbi:MAG: P-loop NTPase [Actinobacteria bacterium]|jgi:Flp pilus assembly CpaE family ATPase|nr:P-loop NTPase [Actinomycetota bacterium]
MIAVLLATPDVATESEIVSVAPHCGLRVLRRCVDATDLFAAAACDPDALVVVSAGLPRLAPDVLDRVRAGRRSMVVGLADDAAAVERLRRLGLDVILVVGPSAEDTARALHDVAQRRSDPASPGAAGVWSTGVWGGAGPAEQTGRDAACAVPRAESGSLVAVWGATGAPGRTTVAIGVAEALAESGRSVCLVDADTYGPSVTVALGLLEDASGLVVACRHADNGSLSSGSLRAAASRVRERWYVLGGVGRPDRWAELRPGALERVWDVCREAFDVTVVDVGFCIEDDDSGAWSRRRNAAAVGALSTADHVLAVADATALGAARLAAAWPAVVRASGSAQLTVVQNRSRGRGVELRHEWRRALVDFGVTARVHAVPRDDRAASSCWQQGRSMGESARRSPLRRSLADVAAALVSG